MYLNAELQHTKRSVESVMNPNSYYVFVDGSYRHEVGAGYGAVIVKNGKVIQQIVGNFQSVPLSLQSLGEFTAVIKGVEWCEAKNARRIIVHYDCNGIQDLANKQWRPAHPKSNSQQAYKDYHMFMCTRMSQSGCKIELRKVRAHSCDFLNNWADRLAKMGLYRLTTSQIRKEANLPRQTGKHLMRMIEKIENHPLELQYA